MIQHRQISHHQIPLNHQHPVFRVGLVDDELGYSLQPRRAYDAVKFGIKGTDYKIVLKNAGTRHYQQLVNEFTYIMNDIVDETLGNADPNDYVQFVLKE